MSDTPKTSPQDETRPPRSRRPPRAAADGDATATPPRADTPRRRSPSDRKLREALTNTYQTVGTGVAVFGSRGEGDEALLSLGANIANNAEAAADAWLELADQNDGVKKALQRFTEGSAVANVIAVHVAMAMPFMVARGFIPGFVIGVTNPPQNGNGAGPQ